MKTSVGIPEETLKLRQKLHFTWKVFFRTRFFEIMKCCWGRMSRVFFQTKPTCEISSIACFCVIL